jgi:PAS domain S-box-containing protein
MKLSGIEVSPWLENHADALRNISVSQITGLEHRSIIPLKISDTCHPILVLQNVVVDQTDVIRILHVDDDSSQGDFLNYFLPVSDGTFTIQPICDPGKVLDELRRNRYDCVVTDYQMPGLNGVELAALIRKEFDVPIIIYTGQGSEEVAEAAFTVGIDDYLRKEMDPSHYQVLAKRIRSVVEKKRTELLYKSVVEQTRDALSIFIDGKIEFANQATLKLLDVKDISDIKGKNPFTLSSIQFFKTLKTGFQNYRYIKNNGEDIYLEVSINPITYNGKEAMLCFMRDITEKKYLELEKQISQERFKTLVDLVPDGILSMNPFGFATFVNDTFLKLTGFSRDEIVGKHITSIGTIRKQDLYKHIKTFASIIKGNIPAPIEFHWRKKDGTPAMGEAFISLIEVGGKKEILMITRDITNEKRREKEFENLINFSPDAILELNSKGEILSLNETALKYTDLTKITSIGKNFNTIFKIEDGEIIKLYDILDDPSKIKNIKPFEIKLMNNKNKLVWVETHPRIINIDGENHGIQLILRNITERKELEKEKRYYAEKLDNYIIEHGNKNINKVLEKMINDISLNINKTEEYLSNIISMDESDLINLQGMEESITKVNKIIEYIATEMENSKSIKTSLDMKQLTDTRNK